MENAEVPFKLCHKVGFGHLNTFQVLAKAGFDLGLWK